MQSFFSRHDLSCDITVISCDLAHMESKVDTMYLGVNVLPYNLRF